MTLSPPVVAVPGAPSAHEIARQVRDGVVSAAEVVTECFERITAVEDRLHAWTFLDPELALAQARVIDGSPPRSEAEQPLRGVPVGVKDIIDTADQPTAYGSPIYEGHRPQVDAQVVARLRRAGAIVVGKTVTTEFALFAPGPTVNPYDRDRTPGGSSSGSAAAVAAGTVPLALGTQTAGSVVRPGSFCGVFGAKPTFGRYPTPGVKPCAPSLDTVGVFARDVEDLILADQALAPHVDGVVPLSDDQRMMRVGFCRTDEWGQVEPSARGRIEAAVGELADRLIVDEARMPDGFAGLAEAQVTIMATEALEALADERDNHRELLSVELTSFLDAAPDRRSRHAQAVALTTACRGRIGELFGDHDVLIAPSTIGEPPGRETTGDPLLCRIWTLLGVPAVLVPGLIGDHGLPLGLQMLARPGDERRAWAAAGHVAEMLAA